MTHIGGVRADCASIMQLTAIQIGLPQIISTSGSSEWWDKEWTTGIHKVSTRDPVWLGYEGLDDDGVADTRNHGGVDRAVCAYSAEHYSYWKQTLSLKEFPFGALGENFTVGGLLEATTCVGDIYTIGEAVVQVSQPRQPCWKPARRWKIKDLTAQIERTGRTGFYFRILRHGWVQAGQAFQLQERKHPEWSIARCNEVLYVKKTDYEAARALSECVSLSGGWKDMLFARYRSGTVSGSAK